MAADKNKHSAFNQVRLRWLMINDKHLRSVGWDPSFDGTGSILTKYTTMKSVLQDVHGDCGGIYLYHPRCGI
jgi:hypothetical protein